MIRATTPTHVFTFPSGMSTADMSEILLTYSQGGKPVIEKNKSDLTIQPNKVSIRLTQEEVNMFDAGVVQIQMRAKNMSGDVMASQIFKVKVKQVLNEEIL